MTISLEELRLATRNHGMPLEALRWPITPVGLHYLLVHYDIPLVDKRTWRLEIGGRVERPLTLSLDELRERDAVEAVVTMEKASIAFQFALQIRNKLLEAYQDVMRMPV